MKIWWQWLLFIRVPASLQMAVSLASILLLKSMRTIFRWCGLLTCTRATKSPLSPLLNSATLINALLHRESFHLFTSPSFLIKRLPPSSRLQLWHYPSKFTRVIVGRLQRQIHPTMLPWWTTDHDDDRVPSLSLFLSCFITISFNNNYHDIHS